MLFIVEHASLLRPPLIFLLLGILSKDDDDGSENVGKKRNLRSQT